ncbi:hypothetical protein [Wukongibacter sp. M2B1]
MFLDVPFEDKLLHTIVYGVLLVIILGYYKIKEIRMNRAKK